jgi:hypothetical protein
MAARDTQRLADASENDQALRYRRGKVLAAVVEEAMRRADAMSRLDASLRRSSESRVA